MGLGNDKSTDEIEAKRIIQIIPAPGWSARYTTDKGLETQTALVCWALVEQNGIRWTTGIDADGVGYTDFCEDASNFAGYALDGMPVE